jgi:hypothetical protein
VNSISENQFFNFIHNGYINIKEQINIKNVQVKIYILDTNKNQTIRFTHPINSMINAISDPDTHIKALTKMDNITNRLPNLKCFNHPKNILKTSRDNIYNLLKGIPKLIVPKTIKIQAKSADDIYNAIKLNNMKIPVIFRQAGDHGGISTTLIKDRNELFFNYILDGRDFYITQYIDCKKNNFYRKFRLIIIDGEVFLRHVIKAENWMVHAPIQIDDLKFKKVLSARFNEDIKPKINSTINRIYQILKLDYFGLDCDINEDGTIILFECNANMNVFVETENSLFEEHINNARLKLNDIISKKFLML